MLFQPADHNTHTRVVFITFTRCLSCCWTSSAFFFMTLDWGVTTCITGAHQPCLWTLNFTLFTWDVSGYKMKMLCIWICGGTHCRSVSQNKHRHKHVWFIQTHRHTLNLSPKRFCQSFCISVLLSFVSYVCVKHFSLECNDAYNIPKSYRHVVLTYLNC